MIKLITATLTIGALGAIAAVPDAGNLAPLVRSYRESSTPAGRSAIEGYARTHAKENSGALAQFALGVALFENKDYAGAAQELAHARPQLPAIADYVTYYLAAAQLAQGDASGAQSTLGTLPEFLSVSSPVLAKAVILDAQIRLKLGSAGSEALKPAVQALRAEVGTLVQPDGDFALALGYDATGDGVDAASYYQRVYFMHPATQMAADSWTAMERLRASLGTSYPAPLGPLLLERGQKWIDAKEYSKARAEFTTVAPLLRGVGHNQALVRMGAAQYAGGDYRGAAQYLKTLDLPSDEADAERWYYLEECARQSNNDDAMMDAVKELARHHERSVWRLKALVSAGNRYLLTHQPDKYEPLYRAAWITFPSDSATAYCHWKIAWDAYLANKHDARELMREQVEHYPGDNRAATAMYYLGRLSENENDPASARSYYQKLENEFPNFYYAVLGRERLADGRLVAATASPQVTEWLDAIEFPAHADYSSQTPNEATKTRIERARWLALAGLADFAEAEVRFGSKTDGQPHLLAEEIAATDAAPYLSLRHMKSLAPDYLSTPVASAPKQFWRMLFPLPYSGSLVSSAKRQNLDPYMVAALIRQESEFNPVAHSHANAYGLTQIVPATGRMLARQQGIRWSSPNLLYEPSTNLQLGTRYIRSLLDQWNGRWELTLAAYNAGPGRVKEWMSWGNYREPSEFVEAIPITETREYVQAVIRNAAVYHEVYGTTPVVLDEPDPPSPVISSAPIPASGVPTHKAAAHAVASHAGKSRGSASNTKTLAHAKAGAKKKHRRADA